MITEPLELRYRVLLVALLGVLVALFAVPTIVVWHEPLPIAVALGATGLCVWLVVRTSRRRLILDATGITDTGLVSATTIAWDEVDHYTYFSMGGQQASGGAAAAGGLIAIIAVSLIARAMNKRNPNRSFNLGTLMIRSRDGRKLAVRPAWNEVGSALDRAFAELHPRLAAPADDRFLPLRLTATGIDHPKKGELALPDIERVDAASGQIRLMKRGKRFAWHSIGMKRMRNSLLFLEQLSERGIVVKAANEVFVPAPVMTKLDATNERAAGMPRATVVRR